MPKFNLFSLVIFALPFLSCPVCFLAFHRDFLYQMFKWFAGALPNCLTSLCRTFSEVQVTLCVLYMKKAFDLSLGVTANSWRKTKKSYLFQTLYYENHLYLCA